MKRVFITGADSFVGTFVREYLEKWPELYAVTAVSIRDGAWKALDFSPYDTVYHVAGLAHVDVGRATEQQKREYYAVNAELTIEIAGKAKADGVKQFIFMSSALVYGDSAPIGTEKRITAATPCAPANVYGDSKLQAEKGLLALSSESFRVVILRCPMIYGKGGKGNFLTLEKIARRFPVFPKIENRRSMLYIGNLAEFVRLMIENDEAGIFWPCNREWSSTAELVKMIAACHGRRVILLPGLGWALKGLGHFTGYVNKAFGNLAYEEHLGDYKTDYRLYSLEQSIKETEA